MPRPLLLTERTKRLIALLHAEGKNNKVISVAAGVSESLVSKALRECYQEGLLTITLRTGDLPAEEWERLRAEAGLRNEFTDKLKRLRKAPAAIVTEPEVMVFDSGSTETTARAWANRLAVWAKPVSQEVLKLVLRSRIVGTSWGRTLGVVLAAMRDATPLQPDPPIRFVPLCGEMLDGPPRKTSASSLAYRLDEIVNSDTTHSHSLWLAGVPSHLPVPDPNDCAAVARANVIEDYIRSLPAYAAVFGDGENQHEPPLVERVDMMLTSCGPKERPLGYNGVRCFAATGITESEAKAWLAGDLSGNLLSHPRIRGQAVEKLDRANQAWLGARIEHIQRCARRAQEHRLPGVVLCCIGANKAETVREIARLGLANKILIDVDCWTQLDRLL